MLRYKNPMQRMILAALALACLFPAFALGDDRDDMFYPDNPGRLDRYSKVKSHAEAERGLEEERKRQFGRDERPKSENDKYFEELYSS